MLKHRKVILAISLCSALLYSCKTNESYQKQLNKVDHFFQSKRYKAALIERDELCNLNKDLKTDTSVLGAKLLQANNNYANLEEKYNTLVNTSGKKLTELSAELTAKSKEHDHKEKMLKEREQKLKELQAIIARQDSITNRLNDIVTNALLGFKSDELNVEMKNGKVYISMSDKLLFKSGSASVEEKGKEAIKKMADVLIKNPDIDISVEGHTDNVPIKTSLYKDNWDLSVARATNIVRMLSEEFKVNPKQLTSAGKGEYLPVAPNDTPEGRAKNRRTEIVLSPKLDELFQLLK